MKKLVLKAVRAAGGFGVARVMSARLPRILMYHDFCRLPDPESGAVSVGELKRHFEYLKCHFNVIPLLQLVEKAVSGTPTDKASVVLTVDDGRRNFYDYCYPLLKEFQFPATFYVVTSFIQKEGWVWTDKLFWLRDQPTRAPEVSSQNIESTFQALKKLPLQARDAGIEALATVAGVPTLPPGKYAACSWDELREMAASGLVEIGSHTVTHPILSTISDEKSKTEICESKRQLEQQLGRPVTAFCFPNGKPSDYRDTQIQQVKDAGYRSAALANFGYVPDKPDLFRLPRIAVAGSGDMIDFYKKLDGVEYYRGKVRRLDK